MREISLFIAMSLDGYIADDRGGVGWLGGQGDDGCGFDAYSLFIKDIDTIIMGWNTYRQIAEELAPGAWPYEAQTTYVITHRDMPSSGRVRFVNMPPAELADRLRAQSGGGIWICGGANVCRQLVEADMIDRYYITVMPILLGSGVRLFEGGHELRLRLMQTRAYDGMVDIVYRRRA